MKISIIIVHWNTPDELKTQIAKLKLQKDVEIVVVDNNSEEHPSWIKKQFENIRLIQNTKNLGFAAACNQGAKIAKGEWLLFLNPDVSIGEKDIFQMVEYAEKHKIDACSPQTTNESYKKPLPTPLTLLVEFSFLKRLITLTLFRVKTLTGGCLLIRYEVFKKIKGWDEQFFLWFEDSDLTKRLIGNNYRVGWIPVTIKHKGGLSIERLSWTEQKKLFFQSMNLYSQKHFSYFGKIIIKLVTTLNV